MTGLRLSAVVTAALVVQLAFAGTGFAAPTRARHATLAVDAQFPDPDLARFGSDYYLYSTGPGFPVRRASSPRGPYRKVTTSGRSMPRPPSWVGAGHDGSSHPWAPDVIRVRAPDGSVQYVMYFVGFKKAWGSNCIGVATSHSPDSGFVATATTICASRRGSEAIDPGAFRAFDGKRYLFFKSTAGHARDNRIERIRMDSAQGVRPVPNTRTTVATAHASAMEAPSLFRHGGRVWLFVARGNFANCGYSTQAWSARNVSSAFHPVRFVMTSASSRLCGPGGASVLVSGGTAWIAFHSWVTRSGSRVRVAWVDRLAWTATGRPYLS